MRKPSCFVLWTTFVLGVFLLANCGNKVERSIKKLASAKKEERDAALMELVLARDSAISPLIEALGDEERPTQVRVDIAEALFRIYLRESDAQILSACLAHLNDPSPEVRAKIATVLAYADVKEAIGPLLERLSSESESKVRKEMLTALETLGEWRVGDWVLNVEGGENMTDEQKEGLVEILKRMWKEEEHEEAKEWIEEFLEKMAQQRIQEGDEYVLKGDLARAEAQYVEAKALIPNSVNVNRKLGKFYFDNGWPDKGLSLMKNIELVTYAPHLRGVPTIDGDLSDDAWKEATKITRFYQCISTMRVQPAEGKSEAYIGRAGENLYVGVKGYEESTQNLRTKCTMRDEDVWKDDCVSIYLDPDHDYNRYHQIVVNSIGTIADYGYNVEKGTTAGREAWNIPCKVATKVEETFWTLEIEIPLGEVAETKVRKGTIWGFNVARVRMGNASEFCQWAPTHGTSDSGLRPHLFGFLIFE